MKVFIVARPLGDAGYVVPVYHCDAVFSDCGAIYRVAGREGPLLKAADDVTWFKTGGS
jgi:hypothetical protein